MTNCQQFEEFSWSMYLLQNLFSITLIQMYVESISGNQSEILYGYHKDFDDDNSGQDNHWILQKRNGTTICSIQRGIQNIKDDVNDNLCQLYCVIACLNIKLPSNLRKNDRKIKIDKHKLMAATIRDIINRDDFNTMLEHKMADIQEGFKEMDFLEKEHYLFGMHTRKGNKRKVQYLLNELNVTLDNWGNFGYKHFINHGR